MIDNFERIASRMMEELPLDSLVIVATFPNGKSTGLYHTSRGNAYANVPAMQSALAACEDAIAPDHSTEDDDDAEESYC